MMPSHIWLTTEHQPDKSGLRGNDHVRVARAAEFCQKILSKRREGKGQGHFECSVVFGEGADGSALGGHHPVEQERHELITNQNLKRSKLPFKPHQMARTPEERVQ